MVPTVSLGTGLGAGGRAGMGWRFESFPTHLLGAREEKALPARLGP